MDLDEKAMLKEVFTRLDRSKTGDIRAGDVCAALRRMGHKIKKKEAQDMVWEVDGTGEGALTYDDFVNMFERARSDKSGFEPYRLLNVVEFLMYDKAESGCITLEECVLILSRRFGQNNIQGIQADLRKFFLDSAASGNRRDKLVSFQEFCNQVEVRKMLLYSS